jgi:hypothetical protein
MLMISYSTEDGQYLGPKRHQKERSIYIIEVVWMARINLFFLSIIGTVEYYVSDCNLDFRWV